MAGVVEIKIGILTFYRVPNYGAMLQAYALRAYLENRGHSVCFINYPFPTTFRPSYPWKMLDRRLNFKRAKLKAYYDYGMTEFARLYPQTVLSTTFEELSNQAKAFDVVIVGSDQMWNPKWTSHEMLPLVFLGFVDDSIAKISYAASFGVARWDRDDAMEVGRWLRRFAAISVREQSGVEIVATVGGGRAIVLPDPTLLWDAMFYRSIAGEGEKCSGRYVYKYFLTEFISTNEEEVCLNCCLRGLGIQNVKSDLGLPASLGGYLTCLMFGVRVKISVDTWISRISRADFVVTNSFHGTVFSLIFHRPFITLLIKGRLEGMNERVKTLLNVVGLEGRMIFADDVERVPEIIAQPIDWSYVDMQLMELRKKADSFFNDCNL